MSEGMLKLNPWKGTLISGILMLVIGILIAWLQQDSLKIILIVSGVLCILMGVFHIYEAWKVTLTAAGAVPGIIYVVIGIVLALVPGLVSDVLMAVLAAALIVIGATSLINIGRNFTGNALSHALYIVIAIIMFALGVLALLNLDDTADVVMIVIGALIAFTGVMRMYDAYILKKLDI